MKSEQISVTFPQKEKTIQRRTDPNEGSGEYKHQQLCSCTAGKELGWIAKK